MLNRRETLISKHLDELDEFIDKACEGEDTFQIKIDYELPEDDARLSEADRKSVQRIKADVKARCYAVAQDRIDTIRFLMAADVGADVRLRIATASRRLGHPGLAEILAMKFDEEE